MALAAFLASLEGLDEATAALYRQEGDGYTLDIEGHSLPGMKKKLEELLAEHKAMKDAKAAAEADAESARQAELVKQQKFEELHKEAQAKSKGLEAELADLKRRYAGEKTMLVAEQVCATLTADPARRELIKTTILSAGMVEYDHDTGAVIFKDGADSVESLAKSVAKKYPFLADANNSSGGGAAGGGSNSAGGGQSSDKRKWHEYTSGELLNLKRTDPERFSSLYDEHMKAK